MQKVHGKIRISNDGFECPLTEVPLAFLSTFTGRTGPRPSKHGCFYHSAWQWKHAHRMKEVKRVFYKRIRSHSLLCGASGLRQCSTWSYSHYERRVQEFSSSTHCLGAANEGLVAACRTMRRDIFTVLYAENMFSCSSLCVVMQLFMCAACGTATSSCSPPSGLPGTE